MHAQGNPNGCSLRGCEVSYLLGASSIVNSDLETSQALLRENSSIDSSCDAAKAGLRLGWLARRGRLLLVVGCGCNQLLQFQVVHVKASQRGGVPMWRGVQTQLKGMPKWIDCC